MLRDQEISEQIGKAQELVGQFRTTLGELVAQAHTQGALGHEGLYEDVQSELDRAWDSLGNAYATMADGDPEDYVD